MNITPDIRYIGVNDHTIDLFEGQYRVPHGMSYNSYVILDEKIAVLDTVDARFAPEWFEQLQSTLGNRNPDYLIVQHMEPDHSANLGSFLQRYPSTTVVASAQAKTMIKNFFGIGDNLPFLIIENGATLSLGRHMLNFFSAPMVHWPEVMVTYDRTEKLLFSADGFGKFGALDHEEPWDEEARRYYIGIVGKYGVQVQNLLKKISSLEIQTICPLHGPILTENLQHPLSLYQTWSSYGIEKEGILLAYTSVYGHTRQAVEKLAEQIHKMGGPTVVMRDLARCDLSEAVADAFCFGSVVLATTTYNGDLFPFMKQWIDHLTERNFQGRTIGLMENGSWAPMAAKFMREKLSRCKNLRFVDPVVTIRSAVNAETLQQIEALAGELCRS